MKINNKLKEVRILNYSNELLTTLIDEIIENKKKNIVIELNEKNNDVKSIFNSVNYIKKSYKKYFEENNIKFNLKYSDEYKSNNFFKEINFKMFVSLILMLIVVSTLIVSINYYHQYLDKEKVDKQMVELEGILNQHQVLQTIDDNETDVDYIDELDETTTTKKKSNYVSAYYINFSQVFDTLLQRNPDTVGWLKVNNTRINYPVVQKDTNSYYLNHDFDKKKNSMGWIFMDYRNDPKNLDRNTIIYGHNIKQGIMFGTIKNMMKPGWYNRPENQLIEFNTPEKNMKWKIFSLYKIKATEDYLKNEFQSDEEYIEFLTMIKDRSIKNFGVELNENSKIITLSTCFTNGTRHVVHAVLIEE